MTGNAKLNDPIGRFATVSSRAVGALVT